MAGQNLTPDQIAAAAAVQQQAAQNQQPKPAAAQQQAAPVNPAQPPAQNPPAAEFILTQDQFNQRWAEKMAAIEKDLGMPLKDVKSHIEKSKPKPPTGDPLSGADLKLAKMEALMTAGVPSKQIPLLLQHFNISGKTREEIQASIQALIEAKLLTIEAPAQPGSAPPTPQQPNPVQGAGQQGVPPGPKTWTRAELSKLSPEDYEKNRSEIHAALRDGRVK